MKRVRVRTLLLVILFTALTLGLGIQQRRIAKLERDQKSLASVIEMLESDKKQGWLVREGQGKTPKSRRIATPKATQP